MCRCTLLGYLDDYLGCFQLGGITNKAALSIHIKFFLRRDAFTYLCWILSEMTKHVVDVCELPKTLQNYFPSGMFCIRTGSLWPFQLIHILAIPGMVSLWIVDIPVCGRKYLIVISACIFIMTNDTKNFFHVLIFSLCLLFLQMFKSITEFFIGLFFFCYWILKDLYISK